MGAVVVARALILLSRADKDGQFEMATVNGHQAAGAISSLVPVIKSFQRLRALNQKNAWGAAHMSALRSSSVTDSWE